MEEATQCFVGENLAASAAMWAVFAAESGHRAVGNSDDTAVFAMTASFKDDTKPLPALAALHYTFIRMVVLWRCSLIC